MLMFRLIIILPRLNIIGMFQHGTIRLFIYTAPFHFNTTAMLSELLLDC